MFEDIMDFFNQTTISNDVIKLEKNSVVVQFDLRKTEKTKTASFWCHVF
jgi:hypothetical protein